MIDNCNTIVVFIYAADKDQKIFSTEYKCTVFLHSTLKGIFIA